MSIVVSVVIPTYRRPNLLERCLQALLSQNFPPQAYEVIVVDDGPEDPSTRDLITEIQQRLQASSALLVSPAMTSITIGGPNHGALEGGAYHLLADVAVTPRLVYLPAHDTRGPAAARNLGWRFASGEVIAFTDDDCIPEPDWLAQGVSTFADGVAGVSGRVIVPISPHPTDNEVNTTGLERSDFVTANCFYRRSVLEEVGGFDERFATAWREDSDLYFTFRERDYPLATAVDAIVVHPVRSEQWGSSLRQQRKSFYNALLYKKHPRLYWSYIQPAPPWHYYMMVGALLICLMGILVAKAAIASAGLVIWLVLVSLFAYRRLKNTSHNLSHVAEIVLTSLVIPLLSVFWRIRGAIYWKVLFL